MKGNVGKKERKKEKLRKIEEKTPKSEIMKERNK